MPKLKMGPFTYKNMRVRVLKDITGYLPDNDVSIFAGTEVRVHETIGNCHSVQVEGSRVWPVMIKISDTEIIYP